MKREFEDIPVWKLTVRELFILWDQHQAESFRPSEKTAVLTTRKVSLKTLMSIYGWGRSTVYKMCAARTIPHSRVNGTGQYRFDLDEVEKFIAEGKVRTKQEVIHEFENKKRSLKISK
jgi:excisionase family DNA binding protein